MKDKILEILHDAKCRSRIITITLQEVARRIATAIEQLEPEGAVCKRCQGTGYDGHDRCDPPNPYICEDCNGLGNSPPQQPSDSAGEEVLYRFKDKELGRMDKLVCLAFLEEVTVPRPTVSEEEIDKSWKSFLINNKFKYYDKKGELYWKNGFKAAISELLKDRL